jgi:PAS domain S-box-containing protein
MAMRFENLLEAVPDALVGMDQKGMIRFVNRQTESLFGYDRDQLIGQHIDLVVPETLWQIYAQHRKDYFADPRTRSSGLDLELSGRHHNGGDFPIHVSMSNIDTGDVLLVITGVGDVATQQREVRNAGLAEAIIEYSDDAIIGATLDGTITSWNPAAEKMYGYSASEIIGRSGQLLIPDDRADQMNELLIGLKTGHHVEHLETTRLRKDGSVVSVAVNSAPIYDEGGNIVGVSAAHRDVTEQRRAMEAAQRMAAIVESADDAIMGGSLDGIITSWNPSAERMYGYSSAEILGKSATSLTPADRRGEIRDILAKIKAGLNVEHLETKRIRKDGSTFPVSLTVSPLRNADGVVVGTSVIHRDLTEQKGALATAQRMAAIVESSDDAIIGKTINGIVTSWNAAAARMYGYSSQEIVGKSIELLIPKDRPEELKQILAKVRAGQGVEHFETERVRRDGTVFPISLTVSPIRDADGTVVGASTVARDTTEQVQAAKEVATTSWRYRLLAENASDVVVLTNPDREVTWMSSSVTATLGWTPEDLLGTRLADLIHPDDLAATAAPRDEMYSGRENSAPVGGYLVRLRTKSGDYRWMSTIGTPVADESGAFAGIVGGWRDVDEMVRAREAAKAGEAALRATLDSLMDPHVLLEAVRDETGQIVDFVYVDANPAACAYNHIDYQSLIGTRLLDLQPGIVGYGLLDQYRQVVETGEPLALDDSGYAQELRGGQERRYDVRAARVGDGLSYTWRDVTDRHGAAARLAKSQEQYRRLAENASDVVLMAGPDRRIMWIAPSVTAALGWDPEELVGTQLADLMRADIKIATEADRVEIYDKGHDVNPEGGYLLELRTKSGDYRWMSGRAHALTDPDGTPSGMVAGLRDVNDLVKARQEAQELSDALKTANDSLRDFVAVASHDLRSPLVTIAGFTKVLADNWATLSDGARLKQLGAIQRGVDRLSHLTNDLLTSAKVEAEAEPTQPEHVRLATALASYLEANREQLGAVAVTCAPELVAVVDPSHLTRILDNYLTNAFKYGEPSICIEAERVGGFVELRVRDHGPGVPPELVPRLFTKFDRGDKQATRAAQGTGLGLSIVKALAEANHGDARYQHDQPTGGCFVVRLPAGAA